MITGGANRPATMLIGLLTTYVHSLPIPAAMKTKHHGCTHAMQPWCHTFFTPSRTVASSRLALPFFHHVATPCIYLDITMASIADSHATCWPFLLCSGE